MRRPRNDGSPLVEALLIHLADIGYGRAPLFHVVAPTRCSYAGDMCRNIRALHNFEPPATAEEIHASAVQYVRKISGMNKPSAANSDAFDNAVEEIAAVTHRLVHSLVTTAAPKHREVEAAKARARSAERYAMAK